MPSFREDHRRAWDRIRSIPSQTLETPWGKVVYATKGEGLPLLVSHGVLGSHAEGVDGWWANLPGPGFRAIAPSRFGYFDSTLPDDATPADQADVFERVLDHLDIDRAVVIGYSAGSAAVLEFGLRHSNRVIAIILANCRIGGGVTLGNAFKPLFRAAYNDRVFWALKRFLPSTLDRIMGVPKGYRPGRDIATAIARNRDLLFPMGPRRKGAIFDGFVSNMTADRFALERLAIPTLIISAKDDWLAPYAFANLAAARIAGAQLLTLADGGHFLYGHVEEVQSAINGFIASVTGSELLASEV